jgi:hypothetical protein
MADDFKNSELLWEVPSATSTSSGHVLQDPNCSRSQLYLQTRSVATEVSLQLSLLIYLNASYTKVIQQFQNYYSKIAWCTNDVAHILSKNKNRRQSNAINPPLNE